MSFAKKSWVLVKELQLNNEDFNKIKDGLFKHLKADCKDSRERILVLGYAVHYLTNDPDDDNPNKNADMHVKRIMDEFDINNSPFSTDLAKASESCVLRNIRDVMQDKLIDLDKGDEKVIGQFLNAIYLSDNNKTQSAILRTYETISRDLENTSEHSI